MRNKIFSIFALGALFLATSCSLHDDNETFDTPAAQRIEESIASDKALLESATNGWELHLWMGKDNTGGGYTYFMKFNNGKVSVGSEIADPDMTTSSSYDVIADEGPVLTFNTYNQIFHHAANPEQDGSQIQQDYEFVILRTTNDSIYLRGKKYGNKMVMTRMPDDVKWSDEIAKIQSVDGSLMQTFTLRDNGDSIGTAMLSDERIMEVTAKGNTIDMPYYVSTNGIVLLSPISYNGIDVQHLVYDADKMGFTSPDKGASALSLDVNLPKNYMFYKDFEGKWQLEAGDGSVFNLTLTPAGDGSTYKVSGLGSISVTLKYVKSQGSLQWMPQVVAKTATGNDVYCLGWAPDPKTGRGSIYYSLAFGFNMSRDLSQKGTVLTFEDLSNGYGINSFYLVETTGIPSNSTWVGAAPTGFSFVSSTGEASPYIAFLTYGTMTKVE